MSISFQSLLTPFKVAKERAVGFARAHPVIALSAVAVLAYSALSFTSEPVAEGVASIPFQLGQLAKEEARAGIKKIVKIGASFLSIGIVGSILDRARGMPVAPALAVAPAPVMPVAPALAPAPAPVMPVAPALAVAPAPVMPVTPALAAAPAPVKRLPPISRCARQNRN